MTTQSPGRYSIACTRGPSEFGRLVRTNRTALAGFQASGASRHRWLGDADGAVPFEEDVTYRPSGPRGQRSRCLPGPEGGANDTGRPPRLCSPDRGTESDVNSLRMKARTEKRLIPRHLVTILIGDIQVPTEQYSKQMLSPSTGEVPPVSAGPVVDEEVLHKKFGSAGLSDRPEDAGAVFASVNQAFCHETMTAAVRAVNPGTPLLATKPDRIRLASRSEISDCGPVNRTNEASSDVAAGRIPGDAATDVIRPDSFRRVSGGRLETDPPVVLRS